MTLYEIASAFLAASLWLNHIITINEVHNSYSAAVVRLPCTDAMTNHKVFNSIAIVIKVNFLCNCMYPNLWPGSLISCVGQWIEVYINWSLSLIWTLMIDLINIMHSYYGIMIFALLVLQANTKH
jgi:hypothetical protein